MGSALPRPVEDRLEEATEAVSLPGAPPDGKVVSDTHEEIPIEPAALVEKADSSSSRETHRDASEGRTDAAASGSGRWIFAAVVLLAVGASIGFFLWRGSGRRVEPAAATARSSARVLEEATPAEVPPLDEGTDIPGEDAAAAVPPGSAQPEQSVPAPASGTGHEAVDSTAGEQGPRAEPPPPRPSPPPSRRREPAEEVRPKPVERVVTPEKSRESVSETVPETRADASQPEVSAPPEGAGRPSGSETKPAAFSGLVASATIPVGPLPGEAGESSPTESASAPEAAPVGSGPIPAPPRPKAERGSLQSIADVDREPVSINRVLPGYTARARAFRHEGTITLTVLVDENGRVEDARVIQGIEGSDLDDAALKAVRKWTFEPAMKDGVPVKVWKTERIAFKLCREPPSRFPSLYTVSTPR